MKINEISDTCYDSISISLGELKYPTEMSWYPKKLNLDPLGTLDTIEIVKSKFNKFAKFNYAEFGIYQGSTALAIAEYFPNCNLYLFDYESTILEYSNRFTKYLDRVTFYSSSDKFLDSYNWSLSHLILSKPDLKFDYVFLDGAHTLAIDGLTFFICKRMLSDGGYIDFDDYHWKIEGSSMDPAKVPEITLMYTKEQISDYQVKRVVDAFVKTDTDFVEVVQNKVYRLGNYQNTNEVFSLETTMSEIELECLETHFKFSNNFLEFGSGFSTLLASKFSNLRVLSFETDSKYVDLIYADISKSASNFGNIDIRHVDIGRVGNWGTPLETGSKSKTANYLVAPWEYILESEFEPDLVLIDGRFRISTFLNCLLHLPGVTVLFADYMDRNRYHIIENLIKPKCVVGRIAIFKIPKHRRSKLMSRANQMMLSHAYDPL